MNITLWDKDGKEEIKDFVIIVNNGKAKIYKSFWDADEGKNEIAREVIISIDFNIESVGL